MVIIQGATYFLCSIADMMEIASFDLHQKGINVNRCLRLPRWRIVQIVLPVQLPLPMSSLAIDQTIEMEMEMASLKMPLSKHNPFPRQNEVGPQQAE